jgi:hypothetical protein
MNQLRKRRRWAVVATAMVCVAGAGIAVAEEVWVDRPIAPIRAGMGSIWPVVVEAKRGDKLTVLERKDKWLHVQLGDKDGWLYDNELSARVVAPDAVATADQTQSNGMASANAGKGFLPADYALKKGYTEEPLKTLETNIASVISPDGLEKFMADGKVGDSKPATEVIP